MPEDVRFARWSCSSCGRPGVVTGPAVDDGHGAVDPVPINCFFCFQTGVVRLPPGLDPTRLRVEGDRGSASSVCARCAGEVREFADGLGPPIAVCARCGLAERGAEPPVDPMAWETLYAFNGQRIDRRRVATGWEFWAEFPPPAGKRWLHSARPPEAIVIEAFEPLPGRPLKDVFADIRREAANQQAEAAREMARARWTDVLRPTPPRTHP